MSATHFFAAAKVAAPSFELGQYDNTATALKRPRHQPSALASNRLRSLYGMLLTLVFYGPSWLRKQCPAFHEKFVFVSRKNARNVEESKIRGFHTVD